MSSSVDIKKPTGRPATGVGTPVLVRLQPDQLAKLDAWIAAQPAPFSRPEAVRRLLQLAFSPPETTNCQIAARPVVGR